MLEVIGRLSKIESVGVKTERDLVYKILAERYRLENEMLWQFEMIDEANEDGCEIVREVGLYVTSGTDDVLNMYAVSDYYNLSFINWPVLEKWTEPITVDEIEEWALGLLECVRADVPLEDAIA